MIRKMKKTSFLIACSTMLMFSSLISTTVYADEADTNEISTRDELVDVVKSTMKDGEITHKEEQFIEDNTDSQVLADFSGEKMEKAINIINEGDISVALTEQSDGSMSGKQKISLGDGCCMEVECTDDVDESGIQSVIDNGIDAVSSLFITTALANTEHVSHKVTKHYGNRYYQARFTIEIGSGIAYIQLDNHYNLSSDGITERYGLSTTSSSGYGTSCDEKEPVITDKYATHPGASDTNMYCKYKYSSVIKGATYSGEAVIYSCLSYLSIDRSDKTITLNQQTTKEN